MLASTMDIHDGIGNRPFHLLLDVFDCFSIVWFTGTVFFTSMRFPWYASPCFTLFYTFGALRQISIKATLATAVFYFLHRWYFASNRVPFLWDLLRASSAEPNIQRDSMLSITEYEHQPTFSCAGRNQKQSSQMKNAFNQTSVSAH